MSAQLISPTKVRKYLLTVAASERHHRFQRVSGQTIERIEGEVRRLCVQIVKTAPSKGVTL